MVEIGPPTGRRALALAALISLTLATRLIGLGQPIVENYVGRQIPTAMVARNLLRGSGFLEPRIDVAPPPNLFLVEPPIFAGLAAGMSRIGGIPLDGAGRLLSALGIALGALGLFDLVARREGANAGLVAFAVFIALPVTVRYGRSFQGDALMLGALTAGLACWDRSESGRGASWIGPGFVLVASALALKVTAAFALVPLVAAILRDRRRRKLALVAATLLPAALWYAHAGWLLAAGEGSRGSADNGSLWLRVLIPSAWLRAETYGHILRFLGVRAFTPLGPWLAVWGFVALGREGDRLWRAWALSCLATLAFLAAKLHHEYYWLALSPPLAVGAARTLRVATGQGARGRIVAGLLSIAFLGSAVRLAATTWATPPEWSTLRGAAAEVRAHCLPRDAWVVAPEALLFEADRVGCRLELTDPAAIRAAGEWGKDARLEFRDGGGPAALVEFYRRRGARYFADVRPGLIGRPRLDLHDAIRRRYKILVDRPGVLIARLTEPNEGASHGDGTTESAHADAEPPTRGDAGLAPARGHHP